MLARMDACLESYCDCVIRFISSSCFSSLMRSAGLFVVCECALALVKHIRHAHTHSNIHSHAHITGKYLDMQGGIGDIWLILRFS